MIVLRYITNTTYCTHLSFCFSPGLWTQTLVTGFSPLLLPSERIFLSVYARPLPLMRSAWHAGGWSPSSQDLHWWKLRVLSVCQLSRPMLPCRPSLCSSSMPFFPSSPGVMSTADTISWGHANFVIGNQSASQLAKPSLYWQGRCLDRGSFYYNAGKVPN